MHLRGDYEDQISDREMAMPSLLLHLLEVSSLGWRDPLVPQVLGGFILQKSRYPFPDSVSLEYSDSNPLGKATGLFYSFCS